MGRKLPSPKWTTPNRIALELKSVRLRDFSTATKSPSGGSPPALVVAPFALHSAVIADLAADHSLVGALRDVPGTSATLLDGLAIVDSRHALSRHRRLSRRAQCVDRSNRASSRSCWPMPGRLDVDDLRRPFSRKSSSTGSGGRTDRYSRGAVSVVDTGRRGFPWLHFKNS